MRSTEGSADSVYPYNRAGRRSTRETNAEGVDFAFKLVQLLPMVGSETIVVLELVAVVEALVAWDSWVQGRKLKYLRGGCACAMAGVATRNSALFLPPVGVRASDRLARNIQFQLKRLGRERRGRGGGILRGIQRQ